MVKLSLAVARPGELLGPEHFDHGVTGPVTPALPAVTGPRALEELRRCYFSEHPVPLTALVFEDADYVRLSSERVPHAEHSLLAAVCSAVFQQFNIRSVYARSSYTRRYNVSARAHQPRTDCGAATARPSDSGLDG